MGADFGKVPTAPSQQLPLALQRPVLNWEASAPPQSTAVFTWKLLRKLPAIKSLNYSGKLSPDTKILAMMAMLENHMFRTIQSSARISV